MLLRATQRALRSGARRKSTVVMMRHGESTWNLENKFTGIESGAEGRRPSFFARDERPPRRRAPSSSRESKRPSASTPSSGSDAYRIVPARRLVRLPFI